MRRRRGTSRAKGRQESKRPPSASARGADPTSVARMLDAQPWDDLAPALEACGVDPIAILPRLRRYADALLVWNRSVSNLISRNDEPRLVERHIGQSLEPARWLAECGATRWLDLGSGGGLPALPLAIAGIGRHWTLVESRRTKSLFLRSVLDRIELRYIEIICSRLESLQGADAAREPDTGIGPFDGFTSRATLALDPTLKLAARFVQTGGFAFLWKGSGAGQRPRSEPPWADSWSLEATHCLRDGQTSVLVFQRR